MPVRKAGRSKPQRIDWATRRARAKKKFIPDADSDFAWMARQFVDTIARDVSRFCMTEDELCELERVVDDFRDKLSIHSRPFTRSKKTGVEKDAAREIAERAVRDAGNAIRGNRKIEALAKSLLNIHDRPKHLRKRECPQTAPRLTFAGSVPFSNTVDGVHLIKFRDAQAKLGSKAKPAAAVRLELYVDLVPEDEPIPTWPGERWGGRTWYLRSYTRSPMRVKYPKCNERMRVVYWACWADATGERGPWSPTLATRIEGIDRALPGPVESRTLPRQQQTIIITSGVRQLPDLVEEGRIEDERRLLTDGTGSEAA